MTRRCKPRRRLGRAERIAGSIIAAQAELILRRRALVQAQAKVAETKVHLDKLRALQVRLKAA